MTVQIDYTKAVKKRERNIETQRQKQKKEENFNSLRMLEIKWCWGPRNPTVGSAAVTPRSVAVRPLTSEQ